MDELEAHEEGHRVVAVDLDGTLTNDDIYPKFGKPNREIVKMVEKEFENGSYLTLFTCRLNPDYSMNKASYRRALNNICDWLIEHDLIKYFERVTGNKPFADVYIDNKAQCSKCLK